ncbi:aldo/keto reductase [Marinomonas pollencensis]|uniref:Aryl-alcohol dehydrogenase-like predicted oxidoreductase n=1 Tax=Marinomonas pollencensis TaxID=491954 RepID=A0A3E0DRW8_9GAMM|nr:aldo/keto reductase [Marinomonas pollencensis]REG85072.1 aryl-alcohol dehydrogenase-like predicted oxidoreductase [Marinomonas pollencensis]
MSKHPHLSNPSIGLGCMNLSHAYGSPLSEEAAIKALQAAFEMGYRHFDTATLYGAGKNEQLVGKALKSQRDEFFLASKCGMEMLDGKRVINGRPETLRRQCENSLKRLQTEHIDLYYLHRMDPDVPIEESVGALGDLVKEGKIGGIGLSEVSASIVKRAHKESALTALQTEYSLWTRNPEIAVLETTQALDISFVAFSPVARGYLCGELTDISTLEANDIRNSMPRFSAENYPKNMALLQDFLAMAKDLGCTPAQLALAWVRSKGEHIVPIPGTRSISHMQDNLNASSLTLNAQQCSELDEMIHQGNVSGARYNAAAQADVSTEEFA